METIDAKLRKFLKEHPDGIDLPENGPSLFLRDFQALLDDHERERRAKAGELRDQYVAQTERVLRLKPGVAQRFEAQIQGAEAQLRALPPSTDPEDMMRRKELEELIARLCDRADVAADLEAGRRPIADFLNETPLKPRDLDRRRRRDGSDD